MRYHIDTIPVWDALKNAGECPLCVLRRSIEEADVDRFLGGSVMDPDTRVRVNDRGFCPRHHVLLYSRQNRLGHALMTHTHLQETRTKLQKVMHTAVKGTQDAGGASLLRRAAGQDGGKGALQRAADALDGLADTCILCDSIDDNMNRYAYTFMHLYSTDSAFGTAFRQGQGVCLSHAALLLRMAAETLSAKRRAEFAKDMEALLLGNVDRVEKELEWFTLKFDYRNADKPWNNSRDALERAITKLRGQCIGTDRKGGNTP